MSDGTAGDERELEDDGSLRARTLEVSAVHTSVGPMVKLLVPGFGYMMMPPTDAVELSTSMVQAACACEEYLAAEAASRPTTLNS